MRVSRTVAASAIALILAAAGAAGAVLLLTNETDRHEPGTTTRVSTAPKRHAPKQRPRLVEWTTYGFDAERTHVAPPSSIRPPFRRVWAVHDLSFFEFPPVISKGRLYLGTNHGRVLAVQARSGRIVWQRHFGGCIAASAAITRGLVYFGLMGRPPCEENVGGGVLALDAATGRVRWRAATGVVESSPLVARGLVYVGSWDQNVYALDARTGRVRWRFRTGARVKAGPALANGTLYIGSYDGRMYAIDARTGRLRWSSEGGSFYATPAVSNGKVYTGATDGRIYAYDAGTGRLAWSAATGSFVYGAAAVWRGTVYVGSYDHSFYAFDARDGARRWRVDVGHPISGAPTVLGGLVYFSTCGSCSQYESDESARHSYAVDARSGRFVWSFPDGEYSPVVSDGRLVYLTGFTTLYGLAPKA